MRRHVILVLVALLATAALVSAQEYEPTPDSGHGQESSPTATMHMINGIFRPLALEQVEDPTRPLATTAKPASDFCNEETPPLGISDGGITDVSRFSALGDPVLSCMWGNPGSDQGFRTAWYELTPGFNGLVSLSTLGSTYDTVLAVYTGECGSLTQIACNDDSSYFASRYDLQVQAGKKYYVEVAAWHSSASGPQTMSLVSQLQPSESEWTVTSLGSDTASFRSRHAVVAQGNKLYVIAGQTFVGDNAIRTPIVYEFDTASGRKRSLPSMSAGSDGKGYSNTTAALVNSKIYVPAGYVGVDGEYDGTHWVWKIGDPQWTNTPANNDWVGGFAAIYSEATTFSFTDSKGAGYFLSGGLTGRFPESDTTNGWEARSELYFYSAGQDDWHLLTSMPAGRFGHVAALQIIGGKEHLCVAGGLGKNGETSPRVTLNSTACYDINQGTWSEEYAPLTYRRYFASSAVDSRGNWYVFGGYDDSGKTVPFTERYDIANDRWIPLNAPYNVGNAQNPQDFLKPPRAWSRGAFVGDNLWIVGGEATVGEDPDRRQVLNIVQWAEFLFPGQIADVYPSSYFPLVLLSDPDTRNDTFQTAQWLPFGNSVRDRFLTADDYVNIYDFVVPKSQNVKVKLVHLASGNSLDIVVYDDNKKFEAEGRKPGTADENITRWLSQGRYFVVVERDFPPLGSDPSPAQFRLSVGPG